MCVPAHPRATTFSPVFFLPQWVAGVHRGTDDSHQVLPRRECYNPPSSRMAQTQVIMTRPPYRCAVVRREARLWNESILLRVYRHPMSRWGSADRDAPFP
jgi:hypothetical protein